MTFRPTLDYVRVHCHLFPCYVEKIVSTYAQYLELSQVVYKNLTHPVEFKKKLF
jgi:hypothetical protein